MEKKKKVAFYIRVSSKGQAAEGHGADVQTSICQKIAERMNWEHCYTYHDPEGISGDVKAKNRPEFMKMLEDGKGKERKFKIVVLAHMDRLGRKGRVMDKALDMLFDAGLKVYVNCMFIENTLMGRLLAGIQGQLAQYDKGQLLERMAAGMEKSTLERGEKQGRIPYGYKRIGKGKNLRIEIVKHEADNIRRIYQERKNGSSQRQIANVLNEEDIKPSRADKWAQKTISQILNVEREKIYKGCVRNGENKLDVHWPAILDILNIETEN